MWLLSGRAGSRTMTTKVRQTVYELEVVPQLRVGVVTWRHLALFVAVVAVTCLAIATLWTGAFRPAGWIRPLW